MLWLDLIGAWLLVAGPMYQGALELRAHTVGLREAQTLVPPPRISRWWWLLPPVRFVIGRRAQHRYFIELRKSLSREHLENLAGFLEKALGWWIVTVGAFLIATSLSIRMFGWMCGVAVSPAVAAVLVLLVVYRMRATDRFMSPQ